MTRVAAIALLALASCAGDLTWSAIARSPGDLGVLERRPDELWVFGDGTERPLAWRKLAGTWEQLDLCGRFATSPLGGRLRLELSFDGDDVWALCGRDAKEGQVLIHYAGGAGTPVTLPDDGAFELVPMASGVVLVGDTRLFARHDGGFDAIATLPPASKRPGIGDLAGVDERELYVGNAFWNGETFATWDRPTGPLTVRRGAVWAGLVHLDHAQPVATDVPAAKEVADRRLTFTCLAPDGTFVFANASQILVDFWKVAPGADAPTYIGGLPARAGEPLAAQQIHATSDGALVVLRRPIPPDTITVVEEGVR